jgi:regulator of replication initiation timing
MSEPKECPFCGKEDWYFEQGEEGDTNIACDWCGYKSRIFRTIGAAYRWWQTRPIEDDLRKRIAELEAENIRLGIEYQRMRLALGDIAINSKRALVEGLEANRSLSTVHSDIEWQDDKSPNDTQTQTIVYGKECEE